MNARPVEVRYEQAVYGSFPFWDRGYAVLARSPGCRPEWVAELRAACQRFGEHPGGLAEADLRGLFVLRLKSGPWMIVGVGSPGSDDRGRPGALAFHALFLSPRDYRRSGYDPFAIAGALRNDWTAETATRRLPSGTWTIAPADPPRGPGDPRAARIAGALARGHRVAIEAAAPIEALARQVWAALPARVRRRVSVATWAFGNGNHFDLVALPRLAGVERDASYLDPSALDAPEMEAEEAPAGRRLDLRGRGLARAWPIAGALALLGGVLLGLSWQRADREARARPDAPAPVSTSPRPTLPSTDARPPDRSAYRDDRADPEERRQVAEALLALADRFGVPGAEVATAREEGPAALMALLADRLRYSGPWLSADERARLARSSDRDHALALRWDDQVRRFADDRRLPDDFAQGPLRWQLDTLAWSFHLDPGDDPAIGRRSTAEVPHALGDALAIDVPLRPIGPMAIHPALAAYRDFLGGLPRR